MSILRNSLLSKAYHAGTAAVHDVIHFTHPYVHAIEQPISNIYTETKTVVTGAWNVSNSIIHLAAYWFIGWMAWGWFGDIFPNEKRAITSSVSRAMKRARLE